MGLVLDEQKDNDEVFEKDGLTFLLGEELSRYEGFTVDYSTSFLRKGFMVDIMGYAGGSC
jgi:Fe-S cluster assembly iron-binding protein IscA